MTHYGLTYRLVRATFRLLLCIVGISATTLYAQESCYERYFREHNKEILPTIDENDNSYDELKKEVIARQVLRGETPYAQYIADRYDQPAPMTSAQSHALHRPVILAIDTITGTCRLLSEDGTILADAHIAMVDSTWYMWLSVDPLADKNPSSTPYMYCNGNPIMLIDPDGREVLNEMDYNKDPELFNVAQQHKEIDADNTTITLYAHGSDNSIVLADGKTIRTAKQFQRYLEKYSTVWQDTDDKSDLNIVLMSCNTGNTDRTKSPIAEKIAKQLGIIVFAPSTEVTTKDNAFYGLFRMENVNPVTHKGTVIKDSNHAGSWRAFTSKGVQDLGPQSCLYQNIGSLLKALEYYGK